MRERAREKGGWLVDMCVCFLLMKMEGSREKIRGRGYKQVIK